MSYCTAEHLPVGGQWSTPLEAYMLPQPQKTNGTLFCLSYWASTPVRHTAHAQGGHAHHMVQPPEPASADKGVQAKYTTLFSTCALLCLSASLIHAALSLGKCCAPLQH